MIRLRMLALIAAIITLATAAHSASFLDDFINNIKLDQTTAPRLGNDAPSRALTAGHSLGQTFTTGPEVTEIYQIMVQTPSWNEQWTPGTSLVMALYDSPEKRSKLAEFEMKYEWRSWEDMMVVFPMKTEAKPNTSYYFELTSRGGDGSIGPIIVAPSDYTGGRGYADGKPQDFDLQFQDYVRTTWDRDAAYSSEFALLNLDYPPLAKVKAAVQAKDWDRAAKEMVAHFESRTDLVPPADERRNRKTDPNFDPRDADLAANMSVLDADGNVISLGPNWNHLRWWPTRGGIGLTRTGIRKYLAYGYSQTGDEKYAKAWNDMLKAFLVDLPSPIKAGIISPDAKDLPPVLPGGIAGGSMWAGLSTGARMGHGFAYYAQFVDSPNFTWDVRAAFIFDLAEMANVLAAQKGGGNWATQMTDSLFEFGKTFPEFARSKEFFQMGYDGLLANMRETLAPDGPIGESAGYQGLVAGRYVQVPEDARRLGLSFPEDLRKRIEKAVEFAMYTATPDGHTPAFGDANPESTADTILERGATEFDRPDMLWVATGGREGTKPSRTSVEYPYSNYYVMRSDWSPDALFMVLKNGRYTAHGHNDSLGFVMYALGNPVFVDPGTYIYGTPEAVRHHLTSSHSSISVDGRSVQNGGGPNQFYAGKTIDYLNAVGPGYDGLPDSVRAVRRVAFMKPDYWVFSDMVVGEGVRQVDSHFHYADENAKLDPRTRVAVTTHPTGGNLAVIPARPDSISAEFLDGDVAGAREKLTPAYILKQSVKQSLPVRLDNVMYPFEGLSAGASVKTLKPVGNADAAVSGMEIAGRNTHDYVVFTGEACHKVTFANVDLGAAAQFAAIRKTPSGTVKSFSWVWGKGVVFGGKVLAVSEDPIPSLEVQYDGRVVRVTTDGSHPTLKIAKRGAVSASVNGGLEFSIAGRGDYFRPFDGGSDGSVLVDDEMPGFVIESPLVGGGAGGEDQVGLMYHWSHVSPGRPSKVSYTPVLRKPGVYEVLAFIPHTSLDAGATREAHYTVHFRPGGLHTPPNDAATRTDVSRAEAGVVELRVDQAAAAGKWVSLGMYGMDPDGAKLELQADAETRGPVMLADAVKFRPVR